MTDKEVLQKAIEIAIENGWSQGFNFKEDLRYEYNPIPLEYQAMSICFSHEFAKAFWGEGENQNREFDDFGSPTYKYSDGSFFKIPEWQYHLQQMVLEENPIDYLRKFIDTTENPTNDESSEVKSKSQIKGEELEDKSIEKIMEYKSVSGITIEDIYPKHGFIIDKL